MEVITSSNINKNNFATTSSKQREHIIQEVQRLDILPVLVDILSSFSTNKVNVKDLDNEFGTIRVRLGKLKDVLHSVEGLGVPMDEKTKNLEAVKDSIRCKLGILDSLKISLQEKSTGNFEEVVESTDTSENDNNIKKKDEDVVMTGTGEHPEDKTSRKLNRKSIPVISSVHYLMKDKDNNDLLKIYNEVTEKANMAMESLSASGAHPSSEGNSNLVYDNNNATSNSGNAANNVDIQVADGDNLDILKDEELIDLDQLDDGLLMMQDGDDISAVLDTMGDPPSSGVPNSNINTKKEGNNHSINANDLDFFSKEFFQTNSGQNNSSSNKSAPNTGSGNVTADQEQNFFNNSSINLNDFNLNSDLLGGTSGSVAGNLPATGAADALRFGGFSGDNSANNGNNDHDGNNNGDDNVNGNTNNSFANFDDLGFNMDF